MSSVDEDQSSQPSIGDGDSFSKAKPVEDNHVKMNGLNEDSAGSASESGGGGGIKEPKENGFSNHSIKSSSSNKHSSSHHHSSKSSSSDKHHSSSDSKHKDGSSSSSSKHKDGSSSSSSKHRDGSSSSSKHKDGHSSSSSSKHKEGSSSKHSSSSSSKNKEGSSSSNKDKSSSSSSSSKPKEGSSSDKHSSSSSSKPKDSTSSHSSSSSSKNKDHHSSSKSKEGGSSSKDRSSSSSKDKSKESSSSSKDKHKSSSSSSSKHKDDEKHKSSSEGDKHKSSSSKHEAERPKKEDVKVKQEEPEKSVKKEIKTEDDVDVLSDSPEKVKKEPERLSVSPVKKPAIKSEDESDDDDDKPLSARKKESRSTKRPVEESDYSDEYQDEEDEDSDVPLSARANKAKKLKLDKKAPKKSNAVADKKTAPAKKHKIKHEVKEESHEEPAAKRKKKGTEEEQEVWKWWEEKREDSGVKWTFLEHKGPVFAPNYEPLPKNVRFYYDGKPMQLTEETEELATFYGRMLDHDYTTRDVFNNNFMKDWRKVMTPEEKAKITDIKKCNFTEILEYFKKKSEERKAMSKEEKQKIKKENEEMMKEYGFCIIDHHKEKIGNYKIEPPGLFRGRGDHPKQGMHKKRINPEEVIINCSKDSKIPVPPPGHKWKEVRHDNTVTWLASWTENIQGATKYVMLNAASKLKGEKDWQKYETARKLHKCVDKIRANYQEDWKSKEMRVRQRAVALYFIDKLALRAGNEKEEGETADTVGCCSLRVEHITLHNEKDGKQHVVEFDFLGKDSIRYQNAIPVEKRVFKNLQLFMENKQLEDDLFDRLNTTILNKHLQDLMEGLTAKVFRTFNASKTLSEQLALLTNPNDSVAAKMLAYNRANRAVAILCNHQRAVPKTFEKSMENLMKKIDSKKAEIKQVKKEIKGIKTDYKKEKSVKTKTMYEKKKKTLARLEEQLTKLEVQATDKDENKEIALGTSKLNYLDPRISVAWCKKFGVPLEKVYNKTQRDKFRWAIDMATEHFKF
ncbi:DNA topoisomerase I, mitochondrial-like [Physella acuta]|uniref:DNA topoisomerase I, mitochondrial-like n=1 Tax=Physella acuta TaxID=109671 RepID=UPI0027DE95DF|nr:DNA topoisomerase I, mitochondrial-like [Physella acuta]